jgi:DNA-binding IclR family transcriptional regulator
VEEEPVKRRHGVQSVEVGAALLRALAAADEPQSLANLSRATGMPTGKAHRYLVSYVQTGLVTQDSATSYYDLGPLAQIMGLASLRRNDGMQVAMRRIAGLRDDLNETVMIMISGADGITCAAVAESRQPISLNIRVGTAFPVLSTASGQLFAAYNETDINLQALITRELSAKKQTRKSLAPLLADIRERGLAHVENDIPGTSAISAPIFNHTGVMVAAVTIIGRSQILDVSWTGRPAIALRTFTQSFGAHVR